MDKEIFSTNLWHSCFWVFVLGFQGFLVGRESVLPSCIHVNKNKSLVLKLAVGELFQLKQELSWIGANPQNKFKQILFLSLKSNKK